VWRLTGEGEQLVREWRNEASARRAGWLLVAGSVIVSACTGRDARPPVSSTAAATTTIATNVSISETSSVGAAAPPTTGACTGDCTGTVAFVHPTWGPSTLLTSLDHSRSVVTVPAQGSSPSRSYSVVGCGTARLQVVDAAGTMRWRRDVDVDVCGGFFEPAPVPIDAAGNIFVEYSTVRYPGLIVLRPMPGGIDDLRTLPGGDSEFYDAEAVDTDGDGVLEVKVETNDCRPDCAGGTLTYQTYRWNGVTFVPAGLPVQRCVPTDGSSLLVVADNVKTGNEFDELREVAQLSDVEILGELCAADLVTGIGRFMYDDGDPAHYVLDHRPEYRSVEEACADLSSFAERSSETALQVVQALPCAGVQGVEDQNVSDLLGGTAGTSYDGRFFVSLGGTFADGSVELVGITDLDHDGVADAVVHRLGSTDDGADLFGDVVIYRADRPVPERSVRIGTGLGSGRATIDVDVGYSELTVTDAVFDGGRCCAGHVERRAIEFGADDAARTTGASNTWALVEVRDDSVPVHFLAGTNRATLLVNPAGGREVTATFDARAGQTVTLDQLGPGRPIELELADDSGSIIIDTFGRATLPAGGGVRLNLHATPSSMHLINVTID
jgi:hypothetical protein